MMRSLVLKSCGPLLYSFYLCTEGVEAVLDVFVAAINLLDVADDAGAVGTHGGNEQGDTGTDIRAGHPAATQSQFTVVTYDDGTMGVAEDNLGAHIDEAVDEEQAALEHFLMKEHRAAGLGGYDDEYGEQVGGQSGPWCVGQRHDGTIDERVDDIVFLTRDEEVVTIFLDFDT